MRICNKCGVAKPYDPEAKRNTKASGFRQAKCWDCYLEYTNARNADPTQKAKNNEAMALRNSTPSGKLANIENTKRYRAMYPERSSAAVLAREIALLQRTPSWCDKPKLISMMLNKPAGMALDHIVPLRGRMVSGLHVPHNLCYISKEANSSKNNRWDQSIDAEAW